MMAIHIHEHIMKVRTQDKSELKGKKHGKESAVHVSGENKDDG